MFAEGGNAFDAAAAALLASFVVEPCMSSPGGGVFAACLQAGAGVRILDAFCNTPLAWPRTGPQHEAGSGHASWSEAAGIDFRAIDIDFGQTTERFHAGWASIAVPGAMAALDQLSAKGVLPKSIQAEPALEAAKGHAIDAFQAYDFELLEPILRLDPIGAAAFFQASEARCLPPIHAPYQAPIHAPSDGLPALLLKGEGATLKLDALGGFLQAWAEEAPGWFYQGEPGQALIRAMSDHGGLLRSEDLKGYALQWRKPLVLEMNGQYLYTNPAPSAGGSMLCLALALMEQAGQAGPRGFANSLSWALAETAALRRKADRSYRAASAEDWASDLEAALKRLSGEHIFAQPEGPGPAGGTTHFSILDEAGNAVSLSASNGEGSGTWSKQWGIQWNNMLGEAALFPEGFLKGPNGQRVGSLMSPSLLMGPSLSMAFGTGGAGRIPSALAAVAYRIAFLGIAPDQAILAPRLHWQEGMLEMEPGLDLASLPAGSRSHTWTSNDMFFGGVNAVWQKGGLRQGKADPRRQGHCLRLDLHA